MVAVPVAPLFITAFFAATISVSIMGVYETAIDTILVSFLEDEAENDDKGNITFASGDLATFMKGTKSIADAQEAEAALRHSLLRHHDCARCITSASSRAGVNTFDM